MYKILSIACTLVFSLFILFAFNEALNAGQICYSCGTGSSCKQCASSSGKDTAKDRKICRDRGCKVSGTTSCSTSSNVKVCR